MRLLYVPNEHGDFRQIGFRRPLADLVEQRLIDEVSVFSLLLRIRAGGDRQRHIEDLHRHVAQYQPDVILMQHLVGTGLRGSDFDRMRGVAKFSLIYHEADPYGGRLHPIPREAREIAPRADVVFTVGSGEFATNFLRAGARDVRYESHCFESERHEYRPVSRANTREFDVVVVANRNRPRLRGHPDWRDRIRFVEELERRLRGRLAIYGLNWTGPSARGVVPFDLQARAIRSGWISANWDHYAKEPSYFSNRLPISLAAGSIHATTEHRGYDRLFPADSRDYLLLATDPHALCDRIEEYLEVTSPDERIDAQRRAQQFAYARYRQDEQLVRMLNFDAVHISPGEARKAWYTAKDPVSAV